MTDLLDEMKGDGIEMNVCEMTVRQLRKFPHREWNEKIVFTSIIILPARVDLLSLAKFHLRRFAAQILGFQQPEIWEINHLHDSGFRLLDFVACDGEEPICLLSGCSDVVHVDGIGGYGKDWLHKYNGVPAMIPPSGWSIDCLPKSGLLRMWPNTRKMTCGAALSSFEIFAVEGEE